MYNINDAISDTNYITYINNHFGLTLALIIGHM